MKSITLSIATLSVVTVLMSVGYFANTSLAQGNQTNQIGESGQAALNETGESGQAALNETGEALTNASKSDVAQNISQGAQEVGQTVANKTGDILGSMSEGLKGLGDGSQSK